MTSSHQSEVEARNRFEFGKNWQRFARSIDADAIARAETSLQDKLGLERLDGLTFIDIGCGSGLFSLAARRLGAVVTSFDYDPDSVACTASLKASHRKDDTQWQILEGSALDSEFMASLGQFDIVYSWGVLHHTGEMWRAIDLATQCVRPGGLLFLAIYNHQPLLSTFYLGLKRLYLKLPKTLRPLLVAPYYALMLATHSARVALSVVSGKRLYRDSGERGMNLWHDAVDWVGGYPFEVASPREMVRHINRKGFLLKDIATVGGGLGCNEYVFRSITGPGA